VSLSTHEQKFFTKTDLTVLFRYCSAVCFILVSTIDDSSSGDWEG
jgi:hypothetical protein